MKKRLLILALSATLLTLSNSTFARTVYCTNCGTQATQLANKIQLAAQYSKQVQQYTTQLQQYQAQLLNLKLNPASILGPEVQKLVIGIGDIMASGQSIGGSMKEIEGNFSKTFKDPLSGTFSENFKTWTTSSQDTLGAAMKSAGLIRDAYANDTAALAGLYNKTQKSQGTVAAVQTLSEINVMQVQQMQKLQDLIATQNVASSAFMAAQNSKEQAAVDGDAAIQASFIASKPKALPKLDTSQKTYKKFDLYQ
jgi:type IV secretion system protein TrbJ